MSVYIGQTLLRQFRVDTFIGSGGMGAVYRVWDLKRNVPLAMKVLHADLAEDPSMFKRFKREARALQRLAHPNIVPFYGLQQTSEFAFLLERFVDGPSLKDILRKRRAKPLPIEEALVYLKALSSALGYAHAHEVVHCDVKPGNVMVDQGGSVYLTDFGVARHAESTTTTLGFAGTAAYMAPEQCRGEAVTAETDVYALGVMLYEMLTGRRPFRGTEGETESDGATAAERIRYAHVHILPVDPREVNPKLPKSLAQVITKALSKKPEQRYRSMREFLDAACTSADLHPEQVADRADVPEKLASEVARRVYTTASVSTEKVAPKAFTGVLGRVLPLMQSRKGLAIIGGAGLLLLIGMLIPNMIKPPARENTSSRQRTLEVIAASNIGALSPSPILTTARPTPNHIATNAAQTAAVRQSQAAAFSPTPIPGTLWWPDPSCPHSRIRVGDWTRVGIDPWVANRVRDKPGKKIGEIIGHAQPGTVLKVLDGPVCNEEMLWWYVRTEDGSLKGWTTEGPEGSYLDPGSAYPP
ncbi:MAG: protein kinase [Anaerolineales bacterium]|nr:protein kinase [Anaerolineales bacterium]